MASNVGFRVYTEIERPGRALVQAFLEVETPYITDAMNRFGGMQGLAPADPSMRIAGPAVTIRVPPGSNLMVWKAFEIAQPGDVLVIESRGFTQVAHWGDLTSMVGKELGLAGVVTDGSVRDLPGIREVGFPVFSLPITVPNGALKHGPGEVNVPIAVGGVPVLPGDLIVGDVHGVVVVPRGDAEAVLAGARAVAAAEAQKMAEIREGKLIPGWLARSLDEGGCQIVEGTGG